MLPFYHRSLIHPVGLKIPGVFTNAPGRRLAKLVSTAVKAMLPVKCMLASKSRTVHYIVPK